MEHCLLIYKLRPECLQKTIKNVARLICYNSLQSFKLLRILNKLWGESYRW